MKAKGFTKKNSSTGESGFNIDLLSENKKDAESRGCGGGIPVSVKDIYWCTSEGRLVFL